MANAVLTYKKKRQIINFTYQTQADDIVGKMAIALLDNEMVAFENHSLRRPRCGDPIGLPTGGRRAALPILLNLQDSQVSSAPLAARLFSANLRILWQPTAAAVKVAAHRRLVMIPKANEILKPQGMEIIGPVSFPDTTIPNNDIVDPRFGSDILRVRRDAEKQRPGLPNVLRVIACPFVQGNIFGLTDGGMGGL